MYDNIHHVFKPISENLCRNQGVVKLKSVIARFEQGKYENYIPQIPQEMRWGCVCPTKTAQLLTVSRNNHLSLEGNGRTSIANSKHAGRLKVKIPL